LFPFSPLSPSPLSPSPLTPRGLSHPFSPQAAMTKLGQWLCGLALLGSAWAALALAPPGLQPPAPLRQALLPLPVYLLVAFGCYSLATVGYRLATFNDCEEAAAELQEHIRAARADLRRRGLRL
ncbi:DPM3 mannosyltransferase, partial [Ptilorrhoa leucosticta]|nr:DPM3 mannosyltransferase [Ptilorrhoa leucosticta]